MQLSSNTLGGAELQILLLAIGGAFLIAAALTMRSTWHLRGWRQTKANIVRCHRAGPLGKRASDIPRRKVVVLHEDGTEEVHFRLSGSETIFIAECVYVIDGSPYPAEMPLEHPDSGTLDIWVKPNDPQEYVAELPSYAFALTFGVIGVALIASAAI